MFRSNFGSEAWKLQRDSKLSFRQCLLSKGWKGEWWSALEKKCPSPLYFTLRNHYTLKLERLASEPIDGRDWVEEEGRWSMSLHCPIASLYNFSPFTQGQSAKRYSHFCCQEKCFLTPPPFSCLTQLEWHFSDRLLWPSLLKLDPHIMHAHVFLFFFFPLHCLYYNCNYINTVWLLLMFGFLH